MAAALIACVAGRTNALDYYFRVDTVLSDAVDAPLVDTMVDAVYAV